MPLTKCNPGREVVEHCQSVFVIKPAHVFRKVGVVVWIAGQWHGRKMEWRGLERAARQDVREEATL